MASASIQKPPFEVLKDNRTLKINCSEIHSGNESELFETANKAKALWFDFDKSKPKDYKHLQKLLTKFNFEIITLENLPMAKKDQNNIYYSLLNSKQINEHLHKNVRNLNIINSTLDTEIINKIINAT